MGAFQPLPKAQDDEREEEGLDAAKQKLSEMRGRPFDVDKVLAQNRAREEREREARTRAQDKLEQEHRAARERRHTALAHERDLANQTREQELIEKKINFELAKRSSGKKKREDDAGDQHAAMKQH